MELLFSFSTAQGRGRCLHHPAVFSTSSKLLPEPHCLGEEPVGCFVHLAKSCLKTAEAALEAD